MLTKIIIYAYTQRIYSSRQIAKTVRENIMFMWLAGRQQPDFRTINRFRSERMKEVLETVFTHVLELLVQEQYVSMDYYFLDGTKLEANANRYTFVWKKLSSSTRPSCKKKYIPCSKPSKPPKVKKMRFMRVQTSLSSGKRLHSRQKSWKKPLSNWRNLYKKNRKTKS